MQTPQNAFKRLLLDTEHQECRCACGGVPR